METYFKSSPDQVRQTVHLEFAHDSLTMHIDGSLGAMEFRRYVTTVLASEDHLQDLHLQSG